MLNKEVTARALLAFQHKTTGRLDFTSHAVIPAPVEGGFTLGAGRAFSEEDKETLLNLLMNMDPGLEFIDTRILVKSRSVLVWYNGPQVIDVLFKGASYKAPIPGLIYMASGGVLRCFAFKGKARPTPNTKLYYAPMGNMFQNGSFCTGNCDVPKDNSIASIPGWERFVLQCVNTHMGGAQVLKSAHNYNDVIAFYQGLEASGAKNFPAAELMAVKVKGDHLNLKAAISYRGGEE